MRAKEDEMGIELKTPAVEDDAQRSRDLAVAAGERARIVRWLRWMDRRASRDPAAKAAIDKVCARDCGSSVADIASAIEHGDYVSYETPR